jgi:outer membrane protein assembly factor BamB
MDDRLRALERRARDDEAAGWEHLRALARVLDRRALWCEVARLARAGAPAAAQALARWTPLGELPLGPPEPPRGPWRTTRVVLEGAWLEPVSLVGATGDLLLGHRGVGQGWGRLAALEPTSAAVAPRWVVDTGGLVLWRGDDLLHATTRSRRGASIVARDARTGQVVQAFEVTERVGHIALAHDRGVLRLGDPQTGVTRLRAFDAGADLGRTLWDDDLAPDARVHVGGGVCLVADDEALVARDLETGAVRWQKRAADLGVDLARGRRLDVDPAGVFLHGAPPDDETSSVALVLDPATGERRWARHEDLVLGVEPGPGLVVSTAPSGRVLALDRASGAVRWEADVAGVRAAALVVGDVVLARKVARGPAQGPGQGSTSAAAEVVLDAATGAVATTLVLAALTDVTAVPCPGGAAVAASRPGHLLVVRIARG